MANESRTQLKTYFQTGDIPTQAQFENLIDSSPNKVDDGIPPVLVMSISQSGSNAPDITVRQNTTGETFSFVRNGEGDYTITHSLITSRTWINSANQFANGVGSSFIAVSDGQGSNNGYYTIYIMPGDNQIVFKCYQQDMQTPRELSGLIGNDIFFFPEIRFYT